MKKLLFVPAFFCLFLSVSCIVYADVGLTQDNFPDEAFLNYVERFDENHDGTLSDEECDAVTEISLFDQEISSLTGIEYFPMLEILDCPWCGLKSLDVSQNTKLKYLDCHNNPLTQLDVSHNTLLTGLICQYNYITSLDVTNCQLLGRLECQGNRLSSLQVGTNQHLMYLDCMDNALTTLDVSGLPSLDRFRCERNHLTRLNLGQNNSLFSLTCDENHLQELDITGTPNLQFLGCDRNDLTKLDISHCPKLESVFQPEYEEEHPDLEYFLYYHPDDWENYFACDKDVPVILAGLPKYPEPEVEIEDEYVYYTNPMFYVTDNGAPNYTMMFAKRGEKIHYRFYSDPLVPVKEGSTRLTGYSLLDPGYQMYIEPGEYEAFLILSGEGHKDSIYHYYFSVYNPYLPTPEVLSMEPWQPSPSEPVLFTLSKEYESIKVQLRYYDDDIGDYRSVWEDEQVFTNTDQFSFSVPEEGSYEIVFKCEENGKQSLPVDWEFYVEEIPAPSPDLILPENTRVIKDEAFRGIENVVIRLPGSVESISDTAFEQSVTILAPRGSEAAQICRDMGLNVVEE